MSDKQLVEGPDLDGYYQIYEPDGGYFDYIDVNVDVLQRVYDEIGETLGVAQSRASAEAARHRLTTTADDYAWMQANGYRGVGDLVAKLKEMSE